MAGTVYGRDCSNFHRHLRRIAVQRGWYPRDGPGRHADEAVPVRTFDETELVNTTVCARVNYTSGARRILAIVLWAVAAVPALVFLGNLCPETMPRRAD